MKADRLHRCLYFWIAFGAAALIAAGFTPGPARAADTAAARARVAAGDSLLALGDLAGAETSYHSALDADNRNCPARYGLARIALVRKDAAKAEKELDPCEGKDKYEAFYALGMGRVRLLQDRIDDAEIFLIKASAREGDAVYQKDLEVALVELYERMEIPRLAVDHIDKLAALSPGDTAPHLKKGRILAGLKDYDGAVAAFRQALAINPEEIEASQEIAGIFLRAKRPGDAARELGRIAEVRGEIGDWLSLASALEAAGEPAKAMEAYRRALAADPASDTARLGMARGTFMTGNRDSAFVYFTAVRDSTLFTGADYEAIGRVHLDREQYPEARAAYLKSAALDSTRADAFFFAGYAAFREKDYAAAIPLFERRIALDSATAASTLVNLALCYLQNDQVGKGIETLEQAVRARPEDAQSRLWLAQTLASQSQWARSVEEYKAAVALDSANVDAWRGLGYSLLNQQRYPEAVSAFRKAENLDPRDLQGLIWLGQAYGMAGQLDQAEATFKRALTIAPGSAEAKQNLEEVQKVQKAASRKGKKRSSS
jgi:tetratricopeptide (TPR) repeat protein